MAVWLYLVLWALLLEVSLEVSCSQLSLLVLLQGLSSTELKENPPTNLCTCEPMQSHVIIVYALDCHLYNIAHTYLIVCILFYSCASCSV